MANQSHQVPNDASTNTLLLESTQPTIAGQGYASHVMYGFEVSAFLTMAILACAVPSWWRKTRGH